MSTLGQFPKIRVVALGDDDEELEAKDNASELDLFGQMGNFVGEMVDKAVYQHMAEKALVAEPMAKRAVPGARS